LLREEPGTAVLGVDGYNVPPTRNAPGTEIVSGCMEALEHALVFAQMQFFAIIIAYTIQVACLLAMISAIACMEVLTVLAAILIIQELPVGIKIQKKTSRNIPDRHEKVLVIACINQDAEQDGLVQLEARIVWKRQKKPASLHAGRHMAATL
jgi:hypothetical protein